MKVVKSVPEGVTIHWFKDEEDLSFQSKSLHIKSVTESNFGVYKVEIKQEGITLLTIYRYLYTQGKAE